MVMVLSMRINSSFDVVRLREAEGETIAPAANHGGSGDALRSRQAGSALAASENGSGGDKQRRRQRKAATEKGGDRERRRQRTRRRQRMVGQRTTA
jgi:hypothetical protein